MTMEVKREASEEQESWRPLLPPSLSPAVEHQQEYQHLGRRSSSALREGGGGWGAEVSAAEVKSATSFSSSNYYPTAPNPHHDAVVYPPSIHSAVLSPSPSSAAIPPHTHGLAIVPQGPYGGDYHPSQGVTSQWSHAKSSDCYGPMFCLMEGGKTLGYGFEKPSAIQQRAVIPIISGRDVIAQAQSGIDKTSMISLSVCHVIDTNVHK
ncbi:hypothetical protein ZWY2020_058622 [Hordeum vulgare]|nr:hypothetical protein ZWY2020_058622 [Hordeum vulgare]